MTMMKFPVLLLSCLISTSAAISAKDEFMKKMDHAMHHKRSLGDLQEKLLAVAVRRELADVTAELNLTQYALKYVGCQSIKSFSDDLAQDKNAESVLALNKFVIFRFCESSVCSSYNKYGCSQDYGEYLIDLETYLVTMATYHYARYDEYCATCISCMTGANRWLEDASNATDDATNATDAADSGNAIDTLTCDYDDACQNYKSACSFYGKSTTQYEDYFTCTQYNVGNNVGYLGPHCASDGQTISIGIYDDEDCTDYVGDIVDLEQFTGMTFDKQGMALYDDGKCISCLDGDEFSLYSDNSATGGEGVYELCSVLFEVGGKCNRYLNVEDTSDTYGSYQQEENEKKVCNFIDSLIENHYDEYGEIVLGANGFDVSKWQDYHEFYNVAARRVPPIQIFGLVISIVTMLFFTSYSWYLRSKIAKIADRNKWHPISKPKSAMDAGRISRIQSGITNGRSTSYNSREGFGDGTYSNW